LDLLRNVWRSARGDISAGETDFSAILQTACLSFHYSSPGRRITLPDRGLLFMHKHCRDQTRQSPFRVNLASVQLVCPFRRAEFAPAPAPDFPPTGLTP